MSFNKVIQEDVSFICQENLDWISLSEKNILVTGANGMLPSYIVEVILYLIKLKVIKNAKVYILVRNKEKAFNRFKRYLNEKYLHFLIQDVCEPINISDRIDIIFHAASQASPKYYSIDPIGTLTPNTIGTINLLKFARTKNVQEFIYFSSAEVYGNVNNKQAITETDFGYLDPMNIRSCYAESKRMGETICAAWHSQFNIPVKIIRPFHTYGPGMGIDDGRIFADFVFNIINNQDIMIKSDGSAFRSYCYLKDAVLGYFYILFKGLNGAVYNVGNPYQECSVKDLATILINLFPEKKIKLIINQRFLTLGYMPSNVDRILPDISKIQMLGWSPNVDIKTGFYRTVLSYT